jgi:hypothetical protein
MDRYSFVRVKNSKFSLNRSKAKTRYLRSPKLKLKPKKHFTLVGGIHDKFGDRELVPGVSTFPLYPSLRTDMLKYKDISIETVNNNGQYSLVSTSNLSAITPGTSNGQRLGRSIRLLGFVLRLAVSSIVDEEPCTIPPYCFDFIWDKAKFGLRPTLIPPH